MLHCSRGFFLPLLFFCYSATAQDSSQLAMPKRLLGELETKTSRIDNKITIQSIHYLEKFQRREARLRRRLSKVDSAASQSLFVDVSERYGKLRSQLISDTGHLGLHLSGEYDPHIDSLAGLMGFLGNPSTSGIALKGKTAQLTTALSRFQAIQGKMNDADEIKRYVQSRKQQITAYVQQHANLNGLLGKDLSGMNQDLYYYSQQIHAYKEMLNDPGRAEQEALRLLAKVPAWGHFMQNNSQLAGLFSVPSSYGGSANLEGLQTKDMVSALINNQVASAGPVGNSALQSNIKAAETQLGTYRDKISQYGAGAAGVDNPDFKPNQQKTKTFWKRLEVGTNFQTTRSTNLFPVTSDLGVSVGYKVSNNSVIGVGASYKLGWGNGINHIHFTSQGLGLRSFLDVKVKGTWFASGGLEYNYQQPYQSTQQLRHWDQWTKSGLIGISKVVSKNNRVFKKTKIQVLWDFLSYQQLPKTKPFIFRFGYTL